jgi:hypothetical protein
MPVREIIAKSLGFGMVALACLGGAALVLYGPHAYNDYFSVPVAVLLALIGVGITVAGVVIIAGIVLDARVRQREQSLHVTPRPGPLGPPPPWGMGDVGRPPSERGGAGGGGPRLMSVAVSNVDAPLFIGFLLIWTLAFCIWLAPR